MTYNLIGFRHVFGEFTNKESGEVIPYDNMVFQVSHKPIAEECYGEQVSEIKIQTKYIDDPVSVLETFIGKKVVFDFVPAGKTVRYTGIRLDMT